MAGTLKTIGDLIVSSIETVRAANGYKYNGFATARTHLPTVKANGQATKDGLCWIAGHVLDDSNIRSRGLSRLCDRQILIEIALQRSVMLPSDIAGLDDMCETDEQIRNTVRKMTTLPDNFCIIKIECLKTEEGTPYHYYMLREANVYESYFCAYFQTTLE